jgi:hypothetical protein
LTVRANPLGWQPSRFLADRAEAERAFQLAEQLGSVNAAAAELGTTWPSLRKAFTRHGLGMRARNPEVVRQRAMAAASRRAGQPATPGLDPVFVALNPDALPARERSPGELYQWVRRDEQYATLAPTWSSSCTAKATPASPPPGPGRSFAGLSAATGWPANANVAPTATISTAPVGPIAPADLSNPRSGGWWPMPADLARPTKSTANSGSAPSCVPIWPVMAGGALGPTLHLGPHNYQRSTAERRANQLFRWSGYSISPTRMG